MLDEKGRLFGKINIVDLLVVVIIIAAIAFVGIKYVLPAQKGADAPRPVTMVLHADSSKNYVIDSLEEGAPVYDSSAKVVLGELVSWSTEPCYERLASADGTVDEYVNPDVKMVDVVIKGTGVKGDFGVTIDKTLYGLGHTMVVYCGESKLYVSVKDIEY